MWPFMVFLFHTKSLFSIPSRYLRDKFNSNLSSKQSNTTDTDVRTQIRIYVIKTFLFTEVVALSFEQYWVFK